MYSYHLVHIQEVSFEYKDSSATPSFKALNLLFAAISHSPFSHCHSLGPSPILHDKQGGIRNNKVKHTGTKGGRREQKGAV